LPNEFTLAQEQNDTVLMLEAYRALAVNTALALRQAIWRKEDPRWKVCGIPEVL